jgi:hypothetical protein
MRRRLNLLLLALAMTAALFTTGCQSDDGIENQASRPWNSPKGWEGGFPSGLNEGR